MYKSKSVGVVVPAFNEQDLIGKTIESVPEFVDTIVVVDDCSHDRTAEIVDTYIEQEARQIILLRHEVNQGVGGAIASGYKWMRDHEIDIAVVMAGDAQMDPADMPALLDPVAAGETDYSKGNRLISGDAYRQIPKVRFFGNSVLSLLTKISSGYWRVADSQTGYTAISLKALQRIDWDKMYRRYGQPNDLLVRLNVSGFRVKDVEVKPVYNIGEKSGINVFKASFTIGFLLLRLFLWRLKEKYIIRDFHPLVFFFLLGFILFGVNIAFFIRLVILWSRNGFVPEITFLVWLFSFSSGLMCIFFAMFFDMEANRHLSK